MDKYSYYVGGEFREGKERISVVNPFTEEVFAEFSETTEDDFNFALDKARKVKNEWRLSSFAERKKVLWEITKIILGNRKVLAELESREIGKTYKQSLSIDIPSSLVGFKYYGDLVDSLEKELVKNEKQIDYIKHEPFGVCGLFLPYNTPLAIFGLHAAAAIAAGNSLIVKPSEFGSLSLLKLAEFIDRADIPKGLISIITGRGDNIGAYLSASNIDLISFTGSRESFKKIIAVSKDNPKKTICELGGSNISVIYSDADIDSALNNLIGSSFINQGQMCFGTSLVLVDDKIYADFLSNLKMKVESLNIGDPFGQDTVIGPLPTAQHLKNVQSAVDFVIEKGGKIVCGGKSLEDKGFFYKPTVIEVEKVFYEELFSPVVLIKRVNVSDIENIVCSNPTGFVLQIWSKDLDKARQLAGRAEYGTVWINTFAQMIPQAPFGGMRNSGWARILGKSGFFEYVQQKHIGIGFGKSSIEGFLT